MPNPTDIVNQAVDLDKDEAKVELSSDSDAPLVVLPTTYTPVWVDLWFWNVMILMTAVVVIGFRWPAAWSFILLTKVTPGVGLVWFLVRREWRALALAAGTTAAIGLVSFAIAPGQWFEWVESLRANAAKPEVAAWEGPSWPIRLAAATLLIGVGAWLNAWWVMPVGLFLAQPGSARFGHCSVRGLIIAGVRQFQAGA